MSAGHKPHSMSAEEAIDVLEAAVYSSPEGMDALQCLEEQLEALRAAVQKELDYMDGFPDVEDGSPLALVIESLRLALSNPASERPS